MCGREQSTFRLSVFLAKLAGISVAVLIGIAFMAGLFFSAREEYEEKSSGYQPSKNDYEYTLSQVLSEGTVKVYAEGQGLTWLHIELSSTQDKTVTVGIPAGTLFTPEDSDVQRMIILGAAPHVFVLKQKDRKYGANLPAACVDMHKKVPQTNKRFGYFDAGKVGETSQNFDSSEKTKKQKDNSPASSEHLRMLITSPAFQNASRTIQQYAIWTITDNPQRSQYVQIVVQQTMPKGRNPQMPFMPPPVSSEIDERVFEEIKKLFQQANIPLEEYNAFASRPNYKVLRRGN
jgi:hypothetical protein